MTTTVEQPTLAEEHKHFEDLLLNAELDSIENVLYQITMNVKFHNKLDELAAAEKTFTQLKKEYTAANELTKLKSATDTTHATARDNTLTVLRNNEYIAHLKADLDAYRRYAAMAALRKSVLHNKQEKAAGTFLEFSEKTLGNLVSKGSFADGSPAWLEQRSTGIGGSDVGPILKVGEKKYQYENYQAVIQSKLNPSFDEPEGDQFLTATGRGHAWEEYLRQVFAARHPELHVWYAKDSFEHVEKTWVKANFDGLTSEVENSDFINGLLEIKTSSKPDDWGKESDGFRGMPRNYFYQMLWYMYHAGLTYGRLIVIINDHEIREYSFRMDDPEVAKLVWHMLRETERFWFEKIVNQENKTVAAKRPFKWHTPTSKKKSWETIAAIADTTAQEVVEYDGMLPMYSAEDFLENVQNALHYRERPFIVVDIETSSTSPAYGRVLELSVVRLNTPQSTPEIVFDERFGLPDDLAHKAGVGMTNIHRLTPDMLEGKPLFESPEVQEELMELFMEGTLVVHNKMFESRFFTAFLEDFGKALRTNNIVMLDTMDIMKMAMPDTPNDRLEGFTEYNGVPYVDAHAALADTMMTAEALARFLRTVADTGSWTPERPTHSTRLAAMEAATAYNRD